MPDAAEAPASADKPQAHLTYCFCVDSIGSTARGLRLTTRGFELYNQALVAQIAPHLDKLGLSRALLKFTGDGWLLITHEMGEVPALCCLATIMAHRFKEEMAEATLVTADRIPGLRLAIGSGRDLRVTLPNQQVDFVGDSARRAVRALEEWWHPASHRPPEILVCEPVREIVGRDFDGPGKDVTRTRNRNRKRRKRVEEKYPLFVLGDLRAEAAADFDRPDYYVYTLSVIGKREEAAGVLQEASAQVAIEKEQKPKTAAAHAAALVRRWNQVLASAPDYAAARKALDSAMRTVGATPDVVTYTILIHKSFSYQEAQRLLTQMQQEGISPDVVTYNTLVDKAPRYEEAQRLLAEMQQDKISPNVVTYNTLVSKAGSYEEAKGWLARMREKGVAPDEKTYSTILSKDLSDVPAREVLAWYWEQDYHRGEPLQAAISFYGRKKLIAEALTLVMHYPYLEAAHKVMRQHSAQALEHFGAVTADDPAYGDAQYALAECLRVLGRAAEAVPHHRQALDLAKTDGRREAIARRLREIEQTQP